MNATIFLFILFFVIVQAQKLKTPEKADIENCFDHCSGVIDDLHRSISATEQCLLSKYPSEHNVPKTVEAYKEGAACLCPPISMIASDSNCLSCVKKSFPEFPILVKHCKEKNYEEIVKMIDPSLPNSDTTSGTLRLGFGITIGLLIFGLIYV